MCRKNENFYQIRKRKERKMGKSLLWNNWRLIRDQYYSFLFLFVFSDLLVSDEFWRKVPISTCDHIRVRWNQFFIWIKKKRKEKKRTKFIRKKWLLFTWLVTIQRRWKRWSQFWKLTMAMADKFMYGFPVILLIPNWLQNQ